MDRPLGRTVGHTLEIDESIDCLMGGGPKDLRELVVLFGGETSSETFADTWEWDGTTWTQRASSGPSARTNHAMAYDSARQDSSSARATWG